MNESRAYASIAFDGMDAHSLFMGTSTVMLLIQPETGEIMAANDAALRYYGYSQEAIRHLKISDINILNAEEVKREMRKAKELNRNYFEFRHRLADGSVRDVEVHSAPITLGGQELLYSIVHDSSERFKAQAQLNLQSAALNAAANGVVITDTSGTILWVNPAFTRITGYSLGEAVGQTPRLLKSGEHSEAFYRNLWETVQAGQVWQGEVINRRKDGSHYWEEQTITPVLDAQGNATHFIAIKHDVSKRKELQEAQAKRERYFQALVERSHDGITLVDKDFVVRYVSPSREQLLGYPPEALLHERRSDLLHPEDKEAFEGTLADLAANPGESRRITYRFKHADGSWRWLENNVTNLLDDPDVGAFVFNYRDVTEKVQSEEALRQSEASFKELFRNNPHPMWVYDRKTLAFLTVNDAAVENYGYSEAEFLRMTIRDIRPAEDLPRLEKVIRQNRDAFSRSGEWRHRRKDGSIIDVEINSHTLNYGGREGALVVALDITEEKQAQTALMRSEARFRAVQETSPDGFMIFKSIRDSAGKIVDFERLYVNPAAEKIMGRSEQDLLGKRLLVEMPGHKEEGLFDAYVQVVETGQVWQKEFAYQHEGLDHWFLTTAVKVDDGFGVAFADTTQRKRAEQALAQTKQEALLLARSMQAVATAAAGILSTRSFGELLEVIQTACSSITSFDFFLFGLYDEASNSMHVHGCSDQGVLVDEAIIPLAGTPTERVVKEKRSLLGHTLDDEAAKNAKVVGSSERCESIIRVPVMDGDAVLGALSVQSYVKHAYGEHDVRALEALAAVAATALKNIHYLEQQQQAEAALAESLKRYELVTWATNDLIYDWDVSQDQLQFNEDALGLLGYTATRTVDIAWWMQHVHPGERTEVDKSLSCALEGLEDSWTHEYRFLRADGSYAHVLERGYIVRELSGKAVRMLGAITDLTKQKQAEAAVRQSEARLKKLFDEAPTFMAVTEGPEHVYTMANPVYLQRVGAHRTILGKPAKDAIPEAVEQGLIDMLDQIYASGTSFTGKELLTHFDRDGDGRLEPYYFNVVYQAIPGANGQSKGIMVHGVDVTEQVLARQELEIKGKQVSKLNTELAQHLTRLQALHSIDLTITSSVDLNLSLDMVLQQVLQNLKVDAANVFTYNPHSLHLNYAAGKGFKSDDIQTSYLRIGQGLVGWVALEQKRMHIPMLATEAHRFSRPALITNEGFITYVGVPLIAKGELKGVLELWHRSAFTPHEDWFAFLDALALQAAIAIDNISMFESLQQTNMQLAVAYDATIEGWSKALDLKDHETEGHSLRVTELTIELAQCLDMSEEDLVHVRRGALLHDIGKMGVPDSILLKPGKLTDDEWVSMKKHPTYAYDLLAPIPFLRPALDIPLYHHEKYDGSGYPKGLIGEQIPLAARIFAVVDVYDALSSDRPYRKAWPKQKVLEHIKEQSGSHFDPGVVTTLLALMTDPFMDASPSSLPASMAEPILVKKGG